MVTFSDVAVLLKKGTERKSVSDGFMATVGVKVRFRCSTRLEVKGGLIWSDALDMSGGPVTAGPDHMHAVYLAQELMHVAGMVLHWGKRGASRS
jgi:hypothetical protein